MEVDQLSLQNIKKIVASFFYSHEPETSRDERTGKPKELQQPSVAKTCVMCDYFIKNQTIDNKQLYLVNSVFKLTSRIDLLNVDEIMQDYSQWKPNGQVSSLATAPRTKLLRLLAAIFKVRPLLNTHQGQKNPGLSTTLLNEQI
jgi:hypothetical protein